LPRIPDIGNISDCCWRSIIGLSPRRGSHAAAPIASNCGWTEVSLSPRAGHRALAATQVSGAALYRSVMTGFALLAQTSCLRLWAKPFNIVLKSSYGIILSQSSFGKVPCLSGFVIQ